jgi:hypothetical protein
MTTQIDALKLAFEALEYHTAQTRPIHQTNEAITAIYETLAQPEKEFFKHNVEQPYEWSDWVCPDPKGYLMKCCDCGLVHEAEFGLVRYKSETEREYCDFVDDPNLQAVFRMRRSEQWSPEDTAHRAGGLPMAQPKPEQEPVAMRIPKVGDKVICIEEDSLGTVAYLTAGGSPEIKFDDGSHGTYMLREFAELFRYATNVDADDTSSERVDKTDENVHEPVGSLSVRYHRGCKSMTNTDFDYNGDLPEGDYELYTTPPQRKQLTDEQIFEISNEFVLCMFPVETRTTDRELAFARAIEKAVTRQPQIRPLTDDVMWKLWNAEGNDEMNQQEAIAFARAIEVAHGIKE